MELDLTDPLVRDMAHCNHRPRESWSFGGTLLSVYCDTCGQPWPCATRERLTAMEVLP